MQAPPDDLFQRDSTIPTEDPAIAASQAKQRQQYEKDQKAFEAQLKKQEAAEAKRVKADIAKPGHKEKAEAVTSVQKKELKCHKIRLYFEKLGGKLSFKAPKTLPSNEAEIDELLTRIECELHSNGGIEQAGSAYLNGMAMLEQVTQAWNPLGLQLAGPAASLSRTAAENKAQWDDLITEFAIANAEWFMVGPAKRILLFTAQLVMAVDGANKAAIRGAKPASDELKKRAEAMASKGKEEAK